MTTTVTERYLYLGYVASGDGDMMHRLELLEDDKRTGKFIHFDRKAKNLKNLFLASSYDVEVETPDDAAPGIRSFIFGQAKMLGPWGDRAEREAIRIASDAVEASVANKRRAAKDEDSLRDLAESLGPIRKVYHNTISATERTAIELMVLRALRTYKP